MVQVNQPNKQIERFFRGKRFNVICFDMSSWYDDAQKMITLV